MRGIRIAVLAATGVACSGGPSAKPLAALPDFTLTAVGTAAERPFKRADMLGRVWIVDFVFTRCSGPCPLLSNRLAALGKNLPPQVGLLTVTVDPEGDTPARLRAYAKSFGADDARWVFARGGISDTYQLLYAGFRLPMSTDPKASPEARVIHSTRFILVDKSAAVRGFYDGLGDSDNDALARDARRLLEARS